LPFPCYDPATIFCNYPLPPCSEVCSRPFSFLPIATLRLPSPFISIAITLVLLLSPGGFPPVAFSPPGGKTLSITPARCPAPGGTLSLFHAAFCPPIQGPPGPFVFFGNKVFWDDGCLVQVPASPLCPPSYRLATPAPLAS